MIGSYASRTKGPPRRPSARKGIVLLLVVVVVLMLSLSGLTFVALLHSEHKAVQLSGDEIQAEHLVGSGAELLKAFLALPSAQQAELGGLVDNPEHFRGVLVAGDGRRHGRVSIVSPQPEGEETTGLRFGLQNESAKLNLGVLPEWERREPEAGQRALMRLPGMTEALADALLDWVDADAQRRPQGAEEEDYVALGAPYAPRNAASTSLEELLLVREVTGRLLFGNDANRNGLVDPNEKEDQDRPATVTAGSSDARLPWASLLTVHSAERNTTPEGKPRVDVNAKDLAELYPQLAAVVPEPWARFVVAYRQYGPAKGQGSAAGQEAEIPLDLSSPAKFTIQSVLDLVGARVQIPRANGEKPLLIDSPLPNDPATFRDTLPKLLDYVTTVPGPVIPGRVNIDQAPEIVLRAIPGLDDALVSRIVASREPAGRAATPASPPSSRSGEEPGRRHALWLLTEGLVSLEQMKALLPYVTGGGDVYRAQIVGYFDEPAPATRVEVVLDATGPIPRQVYWKNLRDLGLGYSRQQLGAPERQEAGSRN